MDISAVFGRIRDRRAWVTTMVALGVLVITVAMVVASTGRSGPPVIRLAGLGGTAMAETADAADIALWDPVVHRFELADAARFPAADGPVWRLDPPDDPAASASDLAQRLGVGEPVASPHDRGSYQAGPDDGSGPTLWIGAAGDWHYHDPSGLPEQICVDPPDHGEDPEGGGAPPSEGTQSEDAADPDEAQQDLPRDAPDEPGTRPAADLVPDPCPQPSPPDGVPSADEARRSAERFLAGLDLEPTPVVADVHADEWSAWVGAALRLDDRETDVHFSVAFGAGGAVTSASGTLARPVPVERYPTVDAEAAVARLSSPDGWLRGATTAVDDLAVRGDPVIDPAAPEDPDADPEEVTVRLVHAEPALTSSWAADGSVWLLPAVRFIADGGGIWPVLVIDEDSVEVAEPGSDGPEPAPEPEPLPADPPTAAPEPEPIEPPSDGGDVPEPADDLEALAAEIVGAPEAAAIERIEAAGAIARIVMRDGEAHAVTDDWRSDRINLVIEDERVADAEIG